MPIFGLGFNWRKSQAHLHLLSQFVRGRAASDFTQNEHWRDAWRAVLGESSRRAIDRFVEEGLLVKGDLAAHLDYKYRVLELKAALKASKLKVSGRKAELVARLAEGDPVAAQQLVADVTVLVCSETGQSLAESYLAQQKREREEAGQKSLELMRAGQFREAAYVVANFEARQVFSRGLGIDWEEHDLTRDVAILAVIFEGKPKILDGLPEEERGPLRVAAAMMYLWGKNDLTMGWLPDGFSTNLRFDNNTAARMILFHAQHQVQLREYQQESSIIKGVMIQCAKDSCPTCRKHQGKMYRLTRLDRIPELPIPGCTHEMGCRCTLIPVTKS